MGTERKTKIYEREEQNSAKFLREHDDEYTNIRNTKVTSQAFLYFDY